MSTAGDYSSIRSAVDNLHEWIEDNHSKEVDKLADQYDEDNPDAIRGVSVQLSLTSLKDGYPEIYELLVDPLNESGGTIESSARDAVAKYVAEQHNIDIPDPGIHWDIEWVDPPSEMEVSPGADLSYRAGEMIAIKGRVRVATDAEEWPYEMIHRCTRCRTLWINPIRYRPENVVRGEFPGPADGCDSETCNGSNFERVPEHEDSRLRPYQYLKIEEMLDGTDEKAQPSVASVYAFGPHLTHKYREGATVTVVGRIKFDVDSRGADMWIDASSVTDEERGLAVEITESDRERIEEIVDSISGDETALDFFVENFAPDIYGHKPAKRGLVLALVGSGDDGPFGDDRIHIALVGDPSTGKSDLLARARRISPHAKRASMSMATEVGLVASAVEETIGGSTSWVLKMGPFALGSGGVVTVDELDNASFDLTVLNDALSEGQVMVSKAGINAPVKTEVRVLATANPVGSQFDPHEPLGDQLDFEEEILSRFDLLYPFEDNPEDEDMTEGIAEATASRFLPDDKMEGEFTADLDEELLKKWLRIAQDKYPEMTKEASDRMKQIWTSMRAAGEDSPISLDARKQESIYRLARAHARLRLGDKVTEKDANVASKVVLTMNRMWGGSIEGEGIPPVSETGDDSDEDDGLSVDEKNRVKEMAENGRSTSSIKSQLGLDPSSPGSDEVDEIVASVQDEGGTSPASERSLGAELARPAEGSDDQ